MTQLIVQPVVRALTRRHLTLGGEREPVMCTALIVAVLSVLSLNLALFWLLPVVALAGAAALLIFRALAKKDPFMVQIAIRRRRYRNRYSARSIPAFTKG